jgi:hypothetical protein
VRGARRSALLGLVVLAGGCGGGGARSPGFEGPAPGACVPVPGPLADDATLVGAAGRYRIVLAGEGGGTSVEGALSLQARPQDMLGRGDVRTPLSGSIDIELARVGAQPVRELETEDPAAPGVLVLESDGAAGRSVLLRLGSESNRTDRQAVDAAFAVLDVNHVADEGFFGVWRSGVRTERTEGYFCAWRSGS